MFGLPHGTWPRKGERARSVGYRPEINRPRTANGARGPDLTNGYSHDGDVSELGLLSGRDVGSRRRKAARRTNLAWIRSWSRGARSRITDLWGTPAFSDGPAISGDHTRDD